MGVHTDYDRKRDELRDTLTECLEFVENELMTEKHWGFDEMKAGYAEDIHKVIKEALDRV
jgi:hypothetical protein